MDFPILTCIVLLFHLLIIVEFSMWTFPVSWMPLNNFTSPPVFCESCYMFNPAELLFFSITQSGPSLCWERPHGVMVNVLDCDIIPIESKPQSPYYFNFQTNTLSKGMNPKILSPLGYNILLLFFHKDDFGIW